MADYDVIVVGLGAAGAACAWRLAARGVRVLGLDRFAPPHELGSSHGESRITREIVGEGLEYTPLVRRSHALWRELEAAPGKLFSQVGFLTLARVGGDAPRHGARDFMAETLAVAQASGAPHETFTAPELRRRWPQFLVADDTVGLLDPNAGFLRAEACIAAELAAAARAGAQLSYGERMSAIEPDGAGLAVVTGAARHAAARVILAAGPGLPASYPAMPDGSPSTPRRCTGSLRPTLGPGPRSGRRPSSGSTAMIRPTSSTASRPSQADIPA